jgi:uncharacterized protein (DUF427 family)
VAESVRDYPRPPRVEASPRRVRVVLGGATIVDSTRAQRVLETSHPPVYYVPREDVRPGVLAPAAEGRRTFCEWKGHADYLDVTGGGRRAPRGAWTYPDPAPGFEALRDHVAFYAGPMDACYVDDEQVEPQPGGFYGGWITTDIVGPFKRG